MICNCAAAGCADNMSIQIILRQQLYYIIAQTNTIRNIGQIVKHLAIGVNAGHPTNVLFSDFRKVKTGGHGQRMFGETRD